MKGPEVVGARVCPVCGCLLTGHHSLKNGEWAHEPVENFGLDGDEGMICAEWDSGQLFIYYHDSAAVALGEVVE